jgi:uncharacterized protein (DUF433 family)
MHGRISVDPRICHGQARIKGTRIPAAQILGMLANGDTIDSLLNAYPSIERADILACLEYGAILAEEQVTPIEELATSI